MQALLLSRLKKNRRATPYVVEARVLQEAAPQARLPTQLLKIEGIRSGLLTAAGLSDKSLKYLTPEDIFMLKFILNYLNV